jgi:acyl-CoA reductase-like NAD-dependent aldehyde dehydrogenase
VGRRRPRLAQHRPVGHARRRRRVRAGRRGPIQAGHRAAATQAQPAWGLSTPQQRFDILDAAGTEILARKAELGDLLTREEGKTLPEAIGEVARAGNIFKLGGTKLTTVHSIEETHHVKRLLDRTRRHC